MAKSNNSNNSKTPSLEPVTKTVLIDDESHPDFVFGMVSDGAEDQEQYDSLDELSPLPGGPIPRPFPTFPPHIPFPRFPGRRPRVPDFPPINYCAPVSGCYRLVQSPSVNIGPAVPIRRPVFVVNQLTIKVRVDVDRYFPQNRISIEVTRRFPRTSAHAIAEVTTDSCRGLNNRRIEADITYREGNSALLPGDHIVFEAKRQRGINYSDYTLTISGSNTIARTYNLEFESQFFDSVEFEVDRVSNAGVAVTTYDTSSHPNRPSNLPDETISLKTVYERAGFDVSMSSNTSVIPATGSGANSTWSDSEMHNAMVTFWSKFQNRPQWAMWVLYAARHDQGASLGGVMFDDIGSNHRQGTAIFTNSFIQNAPAGDPNSDAWRQRMTFWTAVHEMGHAFNLAHAWQKALGTPHGAPGDPWIPLQNEPEVRSFMNYPFRVSGGQDSFFSDFRFSFSEDELIFMRHAPRRFVQMGNSDWFENHGFEAPKSLIGQERLKLEIRPNREKNYYRFLEPVVMEMKLTNNSSERVSIDPDMLTDGRHITVFIQREGGATHKWRSMVTRCHEEHNADLNSGESIYGAHIISASTTGSIINEPGFYKVQAAINIDSEIIVSNVLRLYVTLPTTADENMIAPDFFTEDVGRSITFSGAPILSSAANTLKDITKRCKDNPAAKHAAVALSAPLLRDYKILNAETKQRKLEIKSNKAKVDSGAKQQIKALINTPDAAAETLGHISYFTMLSQLADAMKSAGDENGSNDVIKSSVKTMVKRKVLKSIVRSTKEKLASVS